MTSNLKTIEGQITTLDIPAHNVWLKDRDGNEHYFIWGPALHDQMSKLKPYWFTKLTGEQDKDFPDLWKLTACQFFKRPDDWPFKPPAKGYGHGYQPRNENLIVYQTCYKEACETARSMMVMALSCRNEPFDEVEEYNRLLDIALARAIKDGKALIAAGGT